MAMSGFEPTPLEEPTTERVRSGRRAAVAVAVVAMLVVGTLIWKPWDHGSGTPAPGSARPSGSLPAIAAGQTQAATAIPTPFAPGPAIADPSPGPDLAGGQVPAPMNLGFVALPPDDGGTFVYCIYGRTKDVSAGLITMVINPPVVSMGPAARGLVQSVIFRPEIEANSLEGVFSQEWSALNKGRSQRTRVDPSLVALFKPQHVKVDVADLSASAVLRAALVITWIGTDGNPLASQRLYPTAYSPLGDASTEPIPEGCPAHN